MKPSKPPPKTPSVYIEADLYEKICKAAQSLSLPPTVFIRMAAKEKTEKVLRALRRVA